MVSIKWTNKFSGEVGYVRSVSNKEGHFNNTFDESKAKKYDSPSKAEKVIEKLISFGEGDNNNFEIVGA